MIPITQIRVETPCEADWERMEGTDKVRFCAGGAPLTREALPSRRLFLAGLAGMLLALVGGTASASIRKKTDRLTPKPPPMTAGVPVLMGGVTPPPQPLMGKIVPPKLPHPITPPHRKDKRAGG